MWTPQGDSQIVCPRWEQNPAFCFFLFKRLKPAPQPLTDSEKKKIIFLRTIFQSFSLAKKGKETSSSLPFLSRYPI